MVDNIDNRNIEILQSLKLIEVDDNFLDPGFYFGEVDVAVYKKTIEKLIDPENISAVEFKGYGEISKEDFFITAVALLGYESGVDYEEDTIVSLITHIGLTSTSSRKYTNSDFFNHLIELLKAKTKTGSDYFEELCLHGVFKDYNKGKEVPEILVFNGKTQPIFNFAETIFEKVYVEAPLDTDKDGQRDLIAVYIRRPVETNSGMAVPVIYVANPYMMGTNDDLYKGHNVDGDLEIWPQTDIDYEEVQYIPRDRKLPEPRDILGITEASVCEPIEFECTPNWYNYFLVRGYAVVFAGGIGTRGSQGVRTCGSVEETLSTIAVIDWLNKRATGFSNSKDHLEVVAGWCNGNVGMTGKSYLGTLAIAAATSGVEGLKTIVPEAAISNWYEYYRCNGLNVPAIGWQGDDADLLAEHCFSRMFDSDDYREIKDQFDGVFNQIKTDQDRSMSNYNQFWDERNYLNNSDKIKASVFIIHGLRDWNVKPKQFDMLWHDLVKYDVPRKMLLHRGDHIYIHNMKGIAFSDIMNKWYGHWLYDIENHIMDDLPTVTIQNNANTKYWDTSGNWPYDGVEKSEFFIDRADKLVRIKDEYSKSVSFVDDLSLTGFDRSKPDFSHWLDSIVTDPDNQKPYRLTFTGEVLSKNVRISGTVKIQMKARLDMETGIISAMLVDYGKENRQLLERETVEKDAIIYGINAGSDDLVDFIIDENQTDYEVITRGWMNAQNRRDNYNKDDVIANKDYMFTFDMQPIDYTVLKGHKLGLIIYSTDAEATQRPFKVTGFNVQSDSIKVTIPMK